MNQRKRQSRLRRLRRRYIKAAARRRYRGQRVIRAAFLACVLLYLAAAGHFKDRILRVSGESSVELKTEGGDGEETFLEEFYRITFRFREGELIFSHEKTGSGEAP